MNNILSLGTGMSRLKKKLLLYFILIAIVSISVSAEIIFELSSSSLQENIAKGFYNQTKNLLSEPDIDHLRSKVNDDITFAPLMDLRNRMILLLSVVSGSIIGAFYLFTKDIVSPMDGMVEATKRIAEGDLTVTVPVMSEDEIGQVAGLINDMNINLQDLIMQIRQEINRHMEQIIKISFKIGEFVKDDFTDSIISKRVMRMSEFKKMTKFAKEVLMILESMSDELYALQKFVNMYKTYGAHSDVQINSISKRNNFEE